MRMFCSDRRCQWILSSECVSLYPSKVHCWTTGKLVEDELDDRQMHKVVTKEWRKTESAETSQNLVFCFSCRDNSMAWVRCPSDNVWYKYIWTCFPISFCWCTFLWGKKWKWKYIDKHSKESAKLKNAQIYASATGAASSGPCVTSFEGPRSSLGTT